MPVELFEFWLKFGICVDIGDSLVGLRSNAVSGTVSSFDTLKKKHKISVCTKNYYTAFTVN